METNSGVKDTSYKVEPLYVPIGITLVGLIGFIEIYLHSGNEPFFVRVGQYVACTVIVLIAWRYWAISQQWKTKQETRT